MISMEWFDGAVEKPMLLSLELGWFALPKITRAREPTLL